MSDTRFYVELPADEYGNTAYSQAVIEGSVAEHASLGCQLMLITAPPALVKHSGQRLNAYGGWAEVEGPARMLTPQEWEALVAPHLKAPLR